MTKFNGARIVQTDAEGNQKEVFPQTVVDNIIGLDDHIRKIIAEVNNGK